MPETKTKKKTDWLTPVAITLGVAGVGFGLWMILGQKAFAAGDKIDCLFKYNHSGPGGDFKFRVVLGHIIGIGEPFQWFDEEETIPGYLQEFVNPITPSATFEKKETLITYQIPEILSKDKYDLEASIRWPDGSIVSGMRVMADDIIVVK